MNKYSAISLVKNAITGHKNWTRSWRARIQEKYDIIIIGGGGHGPYQTI